MKKLETQTQRALDFIDNKMPALNSTTAGGFLQLGTSSLRLLRRKDVPTALHHSMEDVVKIAAQIDDRRSQGTAISAAKAKAKANIGTAQEAVSKHRGHAAVTMTRRPDT